jgi:3-dehydroquinate synthase
MEQINVHTPSGHYAVLCERGLLERVGAALSALHDVSSVFVLSSPRVWKHWGRPLMKSLRKLGRPQKVLFDDREAVKTLATVEQICRQLARAGADRGSVLLALGGGVVGDVAGYAAASFMRGVRLVQVPTTLVAQVDSAIGGKSGVNLPEGKNLVGAFYQPRLVAADPQVLRTLPSREYRSGIFEVIKYGIIGDPDLFRFLETRVADLLAQEPRALDWVLPRCIAAKARIVSADERETGLRAVLNFGHTFGHALEAATGYRRFLHGEAVGWGMVAAAWLAVETGRLGVADAARIENLIRRVGQRRPILRLFPARLLAMMHGDKKARAGKLRFVLPRRIGEVEIVADVPDSLVRRVLANLGRGKGGAG